MSMATFFLNAVSNSQGVDIDVLHDSCKESSYTPWLETDGCEDQYLEGPWKLIKLQLFHDSRARDGEPARYQGRTYTHAQSYTMPY
jgi:hypothetical protein